MTETFGEQPRPWVLAIGFTPDSDLGQALAKRVAMVKHIEASVNIYNQVRESDYDAVIAVGYLPSEPAAHLNVLQFGGGGEANVRKGVNWRYRAGFTGRAERLLGPDVTAPELAAQIARTSLAPRLLRVNPRELISRSANSVMLDDDGVVAFVREQNGHPCAGFWYRPDLEGRPNPEWWWLPNIEEDRDKWIDAALDAWRSTNPQAFPPSHEDWLDNPDWMTAEEKLAGDALDEARRELEKVIIKQQAVLEQAVQTFQSTRAASREGVRRLLTHQGDELKEEVEKALSYLGFVVTDSDIARSESGNPLLEDLQVADGDWHAIVEVKGYSKSGGKTADFLKIARAATQYERVTGDSADSRWYVVNQNIRTSPDKRPELLATSDMDLNEFALDGGLAIDTRSIFKVVRDVSLGRLSKEDARALLVGCTGRFVY